MRGKLTSIRVINFKAVTDSGKLKLTPLTVFIGNNGSGKSSIVEASQTLQRLTTVGLDAAMQAFKGMEHVKNKAVIKQSARRELFETLVHFHPMRFLLWGRFWNENVHVLPCNSIPNLSSMRQETTTAISWRLTAFKRRIALITQPNRPCG